MDRRLSLLSDRVDVNSLLMVVKVCGCPVKKEISPTVPD